MMCLLTFQKKHIVWKSLKISHLILAFSFNICPIKIDLYSNTVWLQALRFSKTRQIDYFDISNKHSKYEHIAHLAGNVEWDFFCDFQTSWRSLIIQMRQCAWFSTTVLPRDCYTRIKPLKKKSKILIISVKLIFSSSRTFTFLCVHPGPNANESGLKGVCFWVVMIDVAFITTLYHPVFSHANCNLLGDT